ncbi:PREDICTED: protein FAM187B isoform X3 [Chinchilla lanigera]|uniref:Protein FAM187B n=1 Tax=Chinchilla lanigera TaxID=34839 RepID=A0A8C2VPV8_CHILA|nr:PREDICTED: protein FAM187B isoform X3 [Chinchilla lanigera]
MLTTLWLLLSLAVPVPGFYTPISCPRGQKCQLALLSGNDVLLDCPFLKAYWYYHYSLSKEGWLIRPSEISNIKVTSQGNLAISSPLPSQTGVYFCWEEGNTEVTQFEIDFQNINFLYVTHNGLNEMPLQNESLHVGSKAFIFTRWEPWQVCNRCGVPGERKRLGYCYIEEPQEKPMSCGLYLRDQKLPHTRLRPEMQVEACLVPCEHSKEMDQPQFIYDYSQLGKLTDNLWLDCPLASIYRPVSWEANNTPLTWQNELSGKNLHSTLDIPSGGRQLQIFQPAIYRCFVEQEVVAQFNPLGALKPKEPQTRENKTQEPVSKTLSIPLWLKLLPFVGTVLVLGLLLLKTLSPLSGKSRNRTLLVK